MSKERLKEIKNCYKDDLEIAEHAGVCLTKDDYLYLINQAERAYELEEQKADDEHFVAELLEQTKKYFVAEIFEQNRRYRAALEFYADRENYEPDHYDPDTHDYMSMIDHDKGATARKALEG